MLEIVECEDFVYMVLYQNVIFMVKLKLIKWKVLLVFVMDFCVGNFEV